MGDVKDFCDKLFHPVVICHAAANHSTIGLLELAQCTMKAAMHDVGIPDAINCICHLLHGRRHVTQRVHCLFAPEEKEVSDPIPEFHICSVVFGHPTL